MTTPAEQHAADRGLPVLAVIPFELLRVVNGNPMIVRALDGQEILLRLPTPDELLEQARRAGERLAADGLPPGPGMTRDQAAGLAQPIDVDGVVQSLRADLALERQRVSNLANDLKKERQRANQLADDLDRRNSAIQRAQIALRDA